MTSIDRRGLLMAAGAAALGPGAAQAAGARTYDYVFVDLEAPPGAPAARVYADHVRAAGIAEAGGDVLGLFTPQLGWHGRQAALLVSWPADAPKRAAMLARLATLPGVNSATLHRLSATARPAPGDRPQPGGIYVHRWFVIGTPSLPEFVELSTTGWRDFEARFETRIFGLFTADQTERDRAAGVTRLLLCTRYKDHGVWEASRDPTTDAMAAFQRRQKLTRDTWAASTLLTPL